MWLVIDNFVYNVSDWGMSLFTLSSLTLVQRHPGGGAICQGSGVDSTKIFGLFHGKDIGEEYLPRYCIGYLIAGQEMPALKTEDEHGNEIIQ